MPGLYEDQEVAKRECIFSKRGSSHAHTKMQSKFSFYDFLDIFEKYAVSASSIYILNVGTT